MARARWRAILGRVVQRLQQQQARQLAVAVFGPVAGVLDKHPTQPAPVAGLATFMRGP